MKYLSYLNLRVLPIAILMAIAALPVFAKTVTIKGIEYAYDVNTGEAKVHYGGKYKGVLTIPESIEVEGNTYTVTEIEEGAFYYYIEDYISGDTFSSELEGVIIPNTVTKIGYRAFYECISLRNISIPASVTVIDENAFEWYYGYVILEEVIMQDLTAWCNIDFGSEDANPVNRTFTKVYIEGKLLTDQLVIPEGIEKIKKYAFCHFGVTSVKIPESVTEIGYLAFRECYNLTSVYCYNPIPPEIDSQAFYTGDVTLYVPEGSKESYEADPNWSNFPNIEEFDPAGIEEVEADEDDMLPTEYFNLSGMKVATVAPGESPASLPAGLYITRRGSRTAKVLLP